MGKANLYWNSQLHRWEARGKSGGLKWSAGDEGMRLGEGTAFTKMGKLSGTVLPLTSVGTGAAAISTISNMTGLVQGDMVFVTPKAAIAGHLGLAFGYVPSNNLCNVYIQNSKPDSAGSFVAVGADVVYIR